MDTDICYAAIMQFERWFTRVWWGAAFLAMLPIAEIVPRGTIWHTLCVLPFGLILLVTALVVMLVVLVAVRSLLR
jgi:hypothetical protein